MLNKIFVIISCCLVLACGVKGVPLPPLKPAAIGDGKTSYSKETANKKNQIKNKYDYKLEQDSDASSDEE